MSEMFARFFYGSLLNERTWDQPYVAYPAEVANWRRQWRHCVDSSMGPVCALTATADPDGILQGILIPLTAKQLALFDKREEGYRRTSLAPTDVIWSGKSDFKEIYIYTSLDRCLRGGTSQYPLWLSYIECILAGVLRRFGEVGVVRFIESTEGWQTPFFEDRSMPRYRRVNEKGEVQELVTSAERLIIDRKLSAIRGINFV